MILSKDDLKILGKILEEYYRNKAIQKALDGESTQIEVLPKHLEIIQSNYIKKEGQCPKKD